MNDVSDISDTIIPKSDQLNADDLIGSPRIIVVVGVSRGNNESPLVIHYENDNGRPYKPCKTMRKLLVAAWSSDGNQWVGRAMQLYNDPNVKWAGKAVGGPGTGIEIPFDTPINPKLLLIDPLTLKSPSAPIFCAITSFKHPDSLIFIYYTKKKNFLN